MSLHQPPAAGTDARVSTAASDDENPFPSPETLQVVANETRQAILLVLYSSSDVPLQFSALRRRADVDQSARFNYHLQELLGRFVRETPEGYVVTRQCEDLLDAMGEAPAVE